METLRIDILNPKAKEVLKSLEGLDLIKIRVDDQKSELIELFKKLRNQSDLAPTLEEITEEVESVRSSRYAK